VSELASESYSASPIWETRWYRRPQAPGMDDEIFLDEPSLSIRWRAVPKILYAELKGFATCAEFRAALLTGVRAIKERHVVGYVSDARKAKVVVPEDEKWGREVWLPEAVAAGLKRMAVVTAASGLAKVRIRQRGHRNRRSWAVDADAQHCRSGDGLGAKRPLRELATSTDWPGRRRIAATRLAQ
jgi:hypothetical protein